MKLIECTEDLQSWDDYHEFMKSQLNLLAGAGEPFFVSKDKFSFDIAGKPWNGFAVLVGTKGTPCARKLQKEGLIFREGTCSRQGKELSVNGLEPRLVKEAAKTLKKLLLGFKIAGVEADDEGAAGAPATDGATPEARAKRVDELKKLKTDLDRLLSVLNK
jgi:hypothetical protein